MSQIIQSTLEKFPESISKVYQLHFPIPHEVAEQFIDGTNRRVRCMVNGQYEIRSGLMPFEDYWYVLFNTNLQRQSGIEVGTTVQLELEKDDSQYGMDMPEELQVIFDQEPQAQTYFDTLTPGKQRNLIYIVSKVKNTNSRINKALAITTHLTESSGKLNFKRLNELIKYYNNRHGNA